MVSKRLKNKESIKLEVAVDCLRNGCDISAVCIPPEQCMQRLLLLQTYEYYEPISSIGLTAASAYKLFQLESTHLIIHHLYLYQS